MILFSFDVESVGFRGQGFAAGYVVHEFFEGAWNLLESGIYVVHPDQAYGTAKDRDWIMEHVFPAIADELNSKNCCGSLLELRQQFWDKWLKWHNNGAIMLCDCPFPVEFHFIEDCLRDQLPPRQISPYPVIDLATQLLAVGKDPTASYDRLQDELPVHNPLCDAKQSSRIFRNNFNVHQQQHK